MSPTQQSGLGLAGIGVVLGAIAWWQLIRLNRRRATSMLVTVAPAARGGGALQPVGTEAHTAPIYQAHLVEGDPPFAPNTGDELRVYRDKALPNLAHLYRTMPRNLCIGMLADALVLILIGILFLIAGGATAGDFGTAFSTGLMSILGVLGLVLAMETMLQLPGSKRIHGHVLDTRIQPTSGKVTYWALLEYGSPGQQRRVWAPPRFRKPAIGSLATARIAGRPPYDAVRTNPLLLFGMLVLLLIGLSALIMLGDLTFSALR